MPRTSKMATATAETPDSVIVPLRPDQEEQPPADEETQAPEPDEEPDEDEQPERQSRWRGPALNRVELIGRMAKDPDVRVTPSGMHVGYFRVATNGLKEQDTEFHQCTAFGKTAEFLAQYLRTGRLVFIEGRLQTRAYDDQQGIRRRVTTIVANRLQVLDQRRRDEQ